MQTIRTSAGAPLVPLSETALTMKQTYADVPQDVPDYELRTLMGVDDIQFANALLRPASRPPIGEAPSHAHAQTERDLKLADGTVSSLARQLVHAQREAVDADASRKEAEQKVQRVQSQLDNFVGMTKKDLLRIAQLERFIKRHGLRVPKTDDPVAWPLDARRKRRA